MLALKLSKCQKEAYQLSKRCVVRIKVQGFLVIYTGEHCRLECMYDTESIQVSVGKEVLDRAEGPQVVN